MPAEKSPSRHGMEMCCLRGGTLVVVGTIAEFVLMQYCALGCKMRVLLWHLLNEDSVLHNPAFLLVAAALSMCTSHSSEARTTQLVGFLLKGSELPYLFFSKAGSVCAQFL